MLVQATKPNDMCVARTHSTVYECRLPPGSVLPGFGPFVVDRGRGVTGNVLPIIATILEKTARGARDSEIAELVEMVREASPSASIGHDIERLHLHLNAVAQVIRESQVTERGLTLLNETTHDLASTLALQDLLRTIVSRARSLVGANVAYLTRLNEDHTIMRTVAAEGLISPGTWELSASIGIGLVSLIVTSKSFFDTQDYLGDTRFRHSSELDRTFENESIVSLAGFPILNDGEVHGFLFVADRFARRLSGRQISVLGSFALHAGVAMRNANLFSRLSAALKEADHTRAALIDHIKRVEASAAAHDEMTTLLAAGAGLPQFLQRLALQIGGAVLLYDASMRIRDEHASSEYHGRLADDLRKGAIDLGLLIAASAESRHTGRSVVVLSTEDEQCRAIALHGGSGRSETLVLCHARALDAIDIRNVERSAVALTIAKLWNEKRETDRQLASSTLVRHLALVTPPDAATVSAIRDRLKLGSSEAIVFCLVAIAKLDREAQTAIVWECAAQANLLVDLLDDTYVVAGTADAVHTFIRNLTGRRSGWEAGGIVSEPISDLTTASAHFAQLRRSLQAIRRMQPLRHFVDYAEVSLFVRIMEAEDAGRLVRDVTRVLQPIDRLPPRQRIQSKRTLLAYFDRQHNITRTAAELGLHINTVRQRLNVLREITGGWGDPVKALELHFALRLEAILRGPAETPGATGARQQSGRKRTPPRN